MPRILDAEKRWECPNCDAVEVTTKAEAHTRFHTCPGLGGLTAPMVPEGKKSKTRVKALVREDYVGKEDVHYDDNHRPIMAIRTTREDGSYDTAVLASCVNSTGEAVA
jgi:hypothetical protein